RVGPRRQGGRRQPWRARLQRDPVFVLVGREQQRQRLRRPEREHALLQHRAGLRHAVRALLAGDSDAGHRWLAGPEEDCPERSGTLPTHTPLFVGLLIGVVLLVGALTFVPALALGPIVEHLTLIAAK